MDAPDGGVGRRFGLPTGYEENPPASADAVGQGFWAEGAVATDVRMQAPVYRWAAEVARTPEVRTVLDVGCGSARKLVDLVAPHAHVVGCDQASGIRRARREAPDLALVEGDLDDPATWERALGHRPDLVICADVIEHLADPARLLDRLRDLCGPTGLLLLSTPDRSRLDGAPQGGPPRNPRHVREWTAAEMEALLVAHGLGVRERRHLLPRRYSLSVAELRRTVGRARRRLAVPDAHSCMAFLAAPADRPG